MFSVISVWSRDTKHSLPREAGWGVVTITFLARVIVKVSSSVQLPPKLWLCIHLWPSFVWVDQFSRWTIYKSPISQYIISPTETSTKVPFHNIWLVPHTYTSPITQCMLSPVEPSTKVPFHNTSLVPPTYTSPITQYIISPYTSPITQYIISP